MQSAPKTCPKTCLSLGVRVECLERSQMTETLDEKSFLATLDLENGNRGEFLYLSRDPGGEPAPPPDAGDWPLALAEHGLPVPPEEDPLVQHHFVVASHELAPAPRPES